MQFLKTLFWVVVAIVAVIFAMNNWQPAKVMLWGGMILEIKLPILVLVAFLIGFVPTHGWHRAARWRLQRKLDSQERALADIRNLTDPVVPAAPPAPATIVGTAPATVEPPAQS